MKTKKTNRKQSVLAAVGLMPLVAVGWAAGQQVETRMPAMDEPHEGTWLQWPHPDSYGRRAEPQWVEMTRALVTGENVHIIASNQAERTRIIDLLNRGGVSLDRVDFLVCPTNDYWARDNGPIFVFDNSGNLKVTDWGFNGWGEYGSPSTYAADDAVPAAVAVELGVPVVDLNEIVLEGGAVEVDGRGVLMATWSSMSIGRNAGKTKAEIEVHMRRHLGAEKVIWLEGSDGGTLDITDAHIDGFAVFAPGRKIVTMNRADLNYYAVSNADVDVLYAATDLDGEPYEFVYLPLTAGDVTTDDGQALGRGSYVNYYVGNSVVLMPSYNDANDAVARGILEGVYPNRTVVPIDSRHLYEHGGMVHCVTQQQPAIRAVEPAVMKLSVLRVDGEGVAMEFRGEIGGNYRLESSTTLQAGDWTEVETFVLSGESRTFSVARDSATKKFFRVVKL